MFDPIDTPRVFGQPLGVDAAQSLVDGILARMSDRSPTELAHVEIYLNTQRMKRRVAEIFMKRGAMLLPRLRLVTDLASDPISAKLPQPVAPLRRRLELSQFVSALLDKEPYLAPRSALFDLSNSLANLMDEMHGEGVPLQSVLDLDVSDRSGHWENAQKFIGIVQPFFDSALAAPDKESRQRMVIEQLVASWAETAPDHPIIVAGSTGSRGATSLFMEAVSRLPQGAVILPGVDFDMSPDIWDAMADRRKFEDHPQYRFKLFLDKLGMAVSQMTKWGDETTVDTHRNQVISLSLRPAPVTDQWLTDGPRLGDLTHAMDNVTLVEAPTPRTEAETIALRLRQAVSDGVTAALITPDRMLTRQVSAALDRWNIVADDSAGQPLHLSPPGRFIRLCGSLIFDRPTGETLLSVLKHPLAATGSDRGPHLRWTRELELHIRRFGPPYPTDETMRDLSTKDDDHREWADWVAHILDLALSGPKHGALIDHLNHHIALTELAAAGPASGESELWKEAAGREATKTIAELRTHADAAGDLSLHDYASMVSSILSAGVVRNPDNGHPNVLFWGTLEARVQSADLVILGGMNDGVWPETPTPDPWLNRDMRAKAGLLLPERRIGLSAHDYQQAVSAKEVWITRAVRSEEAETVPSRWINRLTNLLNGLPDQNGQIALEAMKQRGSEWVEKAIALATPDGRGTPAKRPSPRPPVSARPKDLSITQIATLIRDPYAIYARKVLDLKPLDPLVPTADAPLKGTIIHAVLEQFIGEKNDPAAPDARDRLMQIAVEKLDAMCPWVVTRRLWLSALDKAADWFLQTEIERQKRGTPTYIEAWGEMMIPGLEFKIKGKADRIDETENGEVILYDYKTGTPPNEKMQYYFDKQLIIEAAMVARGAFAAIGPKPAHDAEFIQIKAGAKPVRAPIATSGAPDKKRKDQLPDLSVDDEWDNFVKLIRAWGNPKRGYTAMMAAQTAAYGGDYDHLSRYGEWDLSQDPEPEDVT